MGRGVDAYRHSNRGHHGRSRACRLLMHPALATESAPAPVFSLSMQATHIISQFLQRKTNHYAAQWHENATDNGYGECTRQKVFPLDPVSKVSSCMMYLTHVYAKNTHEISLITNALVSDFQDLENRFANQNEPRPGNFSITYYI
jgi:hypothetical protein